MKLKSCVPGVRLLAGFAVGIGLLALGGWALLGNTPEVAQARPLNQHCYDVGPLPEQPPDWCGCTWGAVYVDGAPAVGASVSLTFGSGTVITATRPGPGESFPYFGLHADALGARYGDVVTLTATYSGQTLTRTVRLLPDTTREQQVTFAFEASGHWEHWAALPGIQSLAVRGSQLWAGTPAGPVHWDVTTGISRTHVTGLPSNDVHALAIGTDGNVWVGTSAGLSRYDGATWTPQETGLASADVRALAVGADGNIWVGASHSTQGGVSRFDGAHWQPLPDFNGSLPNLVTALAVDSAGDAWVGTDGYGVSRWDGVRWQTYTTDDGLPSDIVRGIAAEPDAVWLATEAVNYGGQWRGGAGRYDMQHATWTAYTHADGLVADDLTAVAVDAAGRKWFGASKGGISLYDGRNWRSYTTACGLDSDHVRDLAAAADGTVWAGTDVGLNRFVAGPACAPPSVTRLTIAPSSSLPGAALDFQVFASPGAGGAAVVSYDWRSDRDGALSSEAAFGLPPALLTPGEHIISVRALAADGLWSSAVTQTLTVRRTWRVMLPLAASGSASPGDSSRSNHDEVGLRRLTAQHRGLNDPPATPEHHIYLPMIALNSSGLPLPTLPGRLWLTPATGNHRVSEQFTIDVRINADAERIAGTDMYIIVDPTRLDVVGVSNGGGFSWMVYHWTAVTGELGIHSGAEGLGDYCQRGGPLTVAHITFRALRAGDAAASFLFVPGGSGGVSKVIACDIDATNILGSVGNGLYRVGN